nr:branched-chain amino acid ABC transporter permease [Candidatus Liberibacter sp.]
MYPLILVFCFSAQESQKYIDNLGIHVLLYVLLAWGMSVTVGFAGLVNLSYVMAYAIGAYSYAILGMRYDLSIFFSLPISVIIAGIFGIVSGLPSLKFRGDYLALITLGIASIAKYVLIQWESLTHGTYGIHVVNRLTFFGIKFDNSRGGFASIFHLPSSPIYFKIFLYYILFALCFLSAWIIKRLRHMSIGNFWKYMRDNQSSFNSFKKNVIFYKLSAFAISAMFGGLCGALLVAWREFVSPYFFEISEGIIILSIVILGGMTSLSGIVGAVIVVIGGAEILCDLNLLDLVFNSHYVSSNVDHSISLIIGVFLVILLSPGVLTSLRQPSPFLNLYKTSGSRTQSKKYK